jgi:hypothetical protein
MKTDSQSMSTVILSLEEAWRAYLSIPPSLAGRVPLSFDQWISTVLVTAISFREDLLDELLKVAEVRRQRKLNSSGK